MKTLLTSIPKQFQFDTILLTNDLVEKNHIRVLIIYQDKTLFRGFICFPAHKPLTKKEQQTDNNIQAEMKLNLLTL